MNPYLWIAAMAGLAAIGPAAEAWHAVRRRFSK